MISNHEYGSGNYNKDLAHILRGDALNLLRPKLDSYISPRPSRPDVPDSTSADTIDLGNILLLPLIEWCSVWSEFWNEILIL